ncbi:MAG: CapA family protein [Anaerolineae bacterium]|nr:CapA family protein [Anaerolineae bacterium]
MAKVFDSIRVEWQLISDFVANRQVRQYRIRTSAESGSVTKQTLTYVEILYNPSTFYTQFTKPLRLLPRYILAILPLILMMLIPFRPGFAQSCDASTGTITRSHFRSETAETTFYHSVYTPPCYDNSTVTYPVVYLMHGSSDDDGQWARLGIQAALDTGIANGTLPPMIVVMPFGEWLANKNQFEAVSWENVFLKELMPLVESQYRIDARRESRAIGGISRGGFWAYEIAFRHPDLFSAVGGHSAFFAEGQAPPDYDPLKLANNAADLDTLRIELDHGNADYAAPGVDLMHQRLDQRGIQHDFTIYPEGQHNNAHWQLHVAEYLDFYSADWKTAASPTPPPIVFATNTPNVPAATLAPTMPTAVPTSTVAPVTTATESWSLFLPVVAFPSLQISTTLDQLGDLRNGQADSKLTLDETTAQALKSLGVNVAPSTMIVADDALQNTLWRDRTLYSLLAFDRLSTHYRVLHINGQHPLDMDLQTYPFAFHTDHPNYEPQKLTRLLMSGVTALTRLTRKELDEKGVDWAASGIQDFVSHADFFHTSNEVSFSPDCPKSVTNQLGEFCSREAHFDLLTKLGLDIVELTGNHNNDFGTDNYLKTLQWYQDHGIYTIGGGANLDAARQPLLLDHHDNKIAMLACNWIGPYYAIAKEASPGAAFCDWDWLRVVIPQLKAENNIVVVTVQYQEYEDYKPTDKQVSDFQGLADLGADVVIGTQAHKPQTFDFYGARTGQESFIHYGLGNLFFDQPFWGNSRFFMDELYIYQGHLLNVDLFTGIIDDLARPRPMTPDEQVNFFAFMFNTQGSFQ